MEINYLCGIDVSKSSFSIAVKDGSFIIKDRLFEMNRSGFSKFEQLIRGFKPNIRIGMESTGIYHKNLSNFLKDSGYNTVEIDPYEMWRFFKFTNSKPTTTDRKSAKTIAEFLEFTKDAFNHKEEPYEDERYSLRHFVREKERIVQDIAKTKTEIRRVLGLVFPEIEKYDSIFSKEILTLLSRFPSSRSICAITYQEFIEQADSILNKGRGRQAKICLKEIYRLACNSIASEFGVYEELLKIKINRLFFLFKEKEDITSLIDQIADKFFKREIEILTSIKGIGRESAIYFMAEIIDIKRFVHKGRLIGFCGLDPIIKQSGQFKARLRISKKGNSHARRIAWIMARCVKKSNPYFREYYLKKRREGKSYKEAIIATSTKLLRTIYALLWENRCFK